MKSSPFDPEFLSLDEAIEKARALSNISGVSQTIVLQIVDNVPKFFVLLTTAYAELREKQLTDDIAPVASVLPNGKIELYMKEFGRAANV